MSHDERHPLFEQARGAPLAPARLDVVRRRLEARATRRTRPWLRATALAAAAAGLAGLMWWREPADPAREAGEASARAAAATAAGGAETRRPAPERAPTVDDSSAARAAGTTEPSAHALTTGARAPSAGPPGRDAPRDPHDPHARPAATARAAPARSPVAPRTRPRDARDDPAPHTVPLPEPPEAEGRGLRPAPARRAHAVMPRVRYEPRAIREFLRVDWARWADRELPEAVARMVEDKDPLGLLAALEGLPKDGVDPDLRALRDDLRDQWDRVSPEVVERLGARPR